MARFFTMGKNRPLALLVLLFPCVSLFASEPVIRSLNVRGMQTGGETLLTIEGDFFGKSPSLLLPFNAKQELKPGGNDKSATFAVKLDSAVIPGLHQLRVVTEGGVSLPVVLGVDQLPQAPFRPEIQALPVALHGVISGSQVLQTGFPGKKGQQLLIEVEAHRLGSKLKPVVHLYSARKQQIAWAWPVAGLQGDCRLHTTLPDDGEYFLTLHDMEYAGEAPGFFRLKIGQWDFVDQVFPPIAGAGESVELLGNVPGAKSETTATGNTETPLAWPPKGAWSGLRPFVQEGRFPVLLEKRTANEPQTLPSLPVGVSGKIAGPHEEDRYKISCSPGQKIRLDLFAERLGSSLDCALVIRNEAGQEIARAEDRPGSTDPLLEYTVPEKTSTVQVCVVESFGRIGTRGIYHLVVENANSPDIRNDWRLSTAIQNLSLAKGESTLIPILLERQGFAGKVMLKAEGLPGKWTGSAGEIPADMEGVLWELKPAEENSVGLFSLQGEAEGGKRKPVLVKNHPLEKTQPWLARELAFAPVKTPPIVFAVEWDSLPAAAGLVPTGKLTLPIKITRANPETVVRVTLVSIQEIPLLNNQPDQNQAIRLEKAVEIPAKAPKGEAVVLVPANPKSLRYDLALKAELLTPNKQSVLAVAHTTVRRLAVKNPILITLEAKGKYEAQLDPKTGTTFKIKGKVERQEGLTGDLTLAIAGLPAGGKVDPTIIKNGISELAVNVVFPPNIAPGNYPQARLTISGLLDPKQPTIRVNSKAIDLAFTVNPPAKQGK